MNIVLLHYAAPPVVGGVESVIRQHARLMANAGHRVCIIAGRGEPFDARIAFTSLPLLDSRQPDILRVKALLDEGRVPEEFEAFAETIAAQLNEVIADADWLIAHNVCSLNKNLPLTAALRRFSESRSSPRLILWHHDLAWTTPRYRSELHDGYPWDLLRTDWPEVIQVVVSQQRRNELAGLLGVGEDRIHVVPNALDSARFLGLSALSESWVKRLQLLQAAPLILLPVRITSRKDIEMALSVLAVLLRNYPLARLLVTGPLGPHNPANAAYLERLRALRRELHLEQAAFFLAELADQPVPDEVIAELYRLADVLFLPSREEGFGIPILEAGLAGVPVFCSDIPALKELGASDVEYFQVDVDPGRVAAQVVGYLDSSSRYRLRKRVLRDYIWEQVYSSRVAPLLESA